MEDGQRAEEEETIISYDIYLKSWFYYCFIWSDFDTLKFGPSNQLSIVISSLSRQSTHVCNNTIEKVGTWASNKNCGVEGAILFINNISTHPNITYTSRQQYKRCWKVASLFSLSNWIYCQGTDSPSSIPVQQQTRPRIPRRVVPVVASALSFAPSTSHFTLCLPLSVSSWVERIHVCSVLILINSSDSTRDGYWVGGMRLWIDWTNESINKMKY